MPINNRTFLCPKCDKPYGDCEHTDKYQVNPKEETGRVLSNSEFSVLLESGEI